MIRIKIQKVGNHWLPNVNHDFGDNIYFDEKAERYINLLDRRTGNRGELEILLDEDRLPWDDLNVLMLGEQDITRYMTTDDDFNMRIYINHHEFTIHSDLYYLLEDQYDLSCNISYQIYIM